MRTNKINYYAVRYRDAKGIDTNIIGVWYRWWAPPEKFNRMSGGWIIASISLSEALKHWAERSG